MKMSDVLRDYRDAGSANRLFALWGFLDDHTFLTKAGHLGVVYRLRGIDDEGLTPNARASVVHRFEGALRLLDERCRVYQYCIKRPVRPVLTAPCARRVADTAIQARTTYLNQKRSSLFDIDTYLVVVYEPGTTPLRTTHLVDFSRNPTQSLRRWLSLQDTLHVLDAELERARTVLHQKLAHLEIQLREFRLERLAKADAFRFFRGLVNYEASVVDAATLHYDTHLDYFMADSPIECHRDHLLIGRRSVRVLSMKEPPSHTFAHVLATLQTVPAEFIACLEWQRLSSDRIRRDIRMRRRHFFNQRVSIVNYIAPDAKSDEVLVDDSATATVRQLGQALTEIEVNGHVFGSCSLTIVLHHDDRRALDNRVAETMKAMAIHDGSLFEETYNLLNAWLSTVPGNSSRNLRRLALLETNVADLSFVFTPDRGEAISPQLPRRPLAFFETPHQTTYAFDLHVADVGHTLVLGATGSGKSFLLNFLITHAQQYDPLTVILDLGHSYRKLATLLQGSYLEIGLGQSHVAINPFAFEPTREHLHFLHAFVRVLLEAGDAYRLSDAEHREVSEAVQNVYVLHRSQHRLLTVANLLPRALGSRLHKWVEGGVYARLFDNVDDTLSVERLQVFDFEAMRSYPALLEPLLFYVLHRINARVLESAETATLKLCVMDEAWRFIQHPMLRAYVQEGLKTWRKRNGALVLSTQTIDDFASPDLLRTVVENCPTKLLLANPALDRRQYADLFQLNETELELLTHLVPREQVLLKRPDVTKVLTLTVDPKSYWIYTNTPLDNARLDAIVHEHGFEAGLERLIASA